MQESNLQLSKVKMLFTYLKKGDNFIAFINSNIASQKLPKYPITFTIINKYYIHHHLFSTIKLFEMNTVPLLLNTSC